MRRALFLFSCCFAAAACIERGEVLRPLTDAGTESEGGTGASDAGSGGMPPVAGGGGSGGVAGMVVTPAAVVSAVSLGQSHAAAVSATRLFTWGANEAGELGQGDTTERHVPTELTSELRFSALACGNDFTCALDELGAAYCFGANERGQLGQGDRTERHAPVHVALPVAARSLTTDFAHVCALLADARLFCWGRNQEGELGQDDSVPPQNDDTARDALEPVEVPGGDFASVDAGDGHTCAIRLDGSLWCWGRNTGHQLGQGDEPQVRRPLQVGTDQDWLRVDSGQQHSVALKRDHSLWVWGLNEASGTGEGYPLGLDSEEVATPTRLGTASGWVTIATRVFHTCAVNRDDELWCWGRNVEGQLGTGDTQLRKEPTLVATGIADVDVSWFTTCALLRSGGIACTGKNEQGELGDGTTDRPFRFTDITASFL
jgi:alpha-tubulin suppressor-like RCC1 family protein